MMFQTRVKPDSVKSYLYVGETEILFLAFFVFVFPDSFSLFSIECPRTFSVDPAGFELTEISLSLSPE